MCSLEFEVDYATYLYLFSSINHYIMCKNNYKKHRSG